MSLLRIKQADGSWSNIPAIKGADGIDGKDGAVQYTAGRYIQIDENTNTINCTVKIGDLVIIDAVPVKDSTNVVSSGGVYDALEAKADKTEIAGLGSEAGFITNSVEDLKNYYKKSETYSQEEVNALIGNLTRLTLQVVQELPEVGTEHIIYLVPNNESGNNVYEEWLFVQSKWEMIGTTEVDLSNYYTKEEIDNLLSQNSESEIVIYTGLSLYFPNQSAYTYKIGTISADIRTEITNIVNSYYIGGGNFTKPIVFDFNGVRLRPIYRGQGTASGGKTTVSFKLELTASSTSDPHKYDLATVEIAFCFEGSQGSFTPYYSSSLYYWGVTAYYINYLSKSNTYAYTPSSDYNPATKKYVDDKVLDAIPQKSTMPTASATYLDKIYQYIGEDTEEFTKGFFYQCISKTDAEGTVTYSWSKLTFGVDGGGDNEFPMPIFEWVNNNTRSYKNRLGYEDSRYNIGPDEASVQKLHEIFTEVQENNIQHFGILMKMTGDKTGSVLLTCATGGHPSTSEFNYVVFTGLHKIDSVYFTLEIMKLEIIFSNGPAKPFTGLSCEELAIKFTSDKRFTNYLNTYGLSKTNTTEFIPTGDYHPATKKYVDDAIANAGGGEAGGSESCTNNIYEIVSSQNLGTSSSDLWSVNDKVLEAMNKYLKGEIDIPSFRITAIGTNTNIYSRDVYLRIGNISGSTYTYFGNHLAIQESGFNNTLMLYDYKMTFTLKQDGVTGNYVLNGSIRWDYSRRRVLAEGIDDSYTPTGDYHPATKKYVDDKVANAGGGNPDLTPYAKLTDVLTKTNTTEYTPASAYHPATKQYVDQTVSSMGGITEESDPTVPLHVKNITQDMITKWNNAPTEEDVTNAATAAVNGAGFVKTETDPAFTASAAFKILDSDLDNWNAKADLADIDSALLTALGGTYSTELASNPAEGSVILTMTDDLKELATKISDGVANDKPPKVTLKVTFNGMEEDLVFTPTNYNKPDGKCWFKAIVMNTPDSDYSPHNPAACSIATLYAYYLNATNKTLELSYSSMTSIHDLNEANWVNATISSTGDVPGMPNYSMGLHSNGSIALTTTLDLAYLNEFHEFLPWTGANAPTTTRDKIVLGILGNKLCIDWGYNGTRLTKGYYQTFSEMMEAIKVKDESSNDYGKYILAECFIAPSAGGVYVYNAYGQELEHDSISEIFSFLYDYQYDRVYLRGSDSGQIIVAQLRYEDAYTAGSSLYANTYRVTLEIDPDENKALSSSTVDLGKIVGMHSLQTFSPVYNKFSYKGLLPNFAVNEDGYIRYVTFVSIDQGKPAIWN
jgi:hypothetical protein